MGELTREQIEASLQFLASIGNVKVMSSRNELATLYRMALRALAYERATGYDDPERLDLVLGRAGVDTHLDVLNRMRLDAEKAHDDARALDTGWQPMSMKTADVIDHVLGTYCANLIDPDPEAAEALTEFRARRNSPAFTVDPKAVEATRARTIPARLRDPSTPGHVHATTPPGPRHAVAVPDAPCTRCRGFGSSPDVEGGPCRYCHGTGRVKGGV